VLQWAVEGYGGAHVLGQEQRAELATAVHKAACDLAATRLDAMTAPLELTSLGSMQRCVACAQTWRARRHGRKTP
jgi:hypothetical protein